MKKSKIIWITGCCLLFSGLLQIPILRLPYNAISVMFFELQVAVKFLWLCTFKELCDIETLPPDYQRLIFKGQWQLAGILLSVLAVYLLKRRKL